jgi:hypothetical protein
MFLNPEEIKQLTGKTRYPAQVRELKRQHIIFGVRGDGSPVVLEEHIKNTFDEKTKTANKEGEPNWDAICQSSV